jgi:hypothetical protein
MLAAFATGQKAAISDQLPSGQGPSFDFSILAPTPWADHFAIDSVTIIALSDVGEVTARILDFNNSERLFERQALQVIGRYPSAAAATRMVRRT